MRRVILSIVVAVGLSASVVHGRVFWRWRRQDAPGRALVQAGAERGYKAPVSINGADATAEVFRLPERNMSGSLALMQRTFPDMAFSHAGGNLAIGQDESGNTLIVIQPTAADPVTVFAIRAGRGTVPAYPDRHLFEHLPPFPGSRQVFHAADRHTGASLAIATTTAPPHAVLDFYTGQLVTAGWNPVFPPSHARSMHVFLRDREIVTLSAVSDSPRQPTRITLLHKEPGTIRD